MDHMIHLEGMVRGCVAELRLNDIPLARLVPGGLERLSRPVHEFLIPGRNGLTLVVEPGPMPSQALAPQGRGRRPGAAASIRLARYPLGSFTGTDAAEVLGELTWQDPGEEHPLPVVLRGEAAADLGLGRWAWQDAPALAPRDLAAPELIAAVAALHGALAARNPEAIAAALGTHYAEAARAYPVRSAARLAAEFVEGVRQVAAGSDWGVPPFDPARTDFRLCAEGRLVEILDRDWLPTLRTRPLRAIGNQPYAIALYMGRPGGEWRVLR